MRILLLNFNAENFCEDLHKSIVNFFPQDNAINPYNLNMIFDNFIKIVKTAVDNYAPLKKLSRRQRKLTLYLSHFSYGSAEKRNFYKK